MHRVFDAIPSASALRQVGHHLTPYGGISAISPVAEVGPCAAIKRIVAVLPVQHVVPAAAHQAVLAITAAEAIVPAAATDHIVAIPPLDHVIAAQADDDIPLGGAENEVVAEGALTHLVPHPIDGAPQGRREPLAGGAALSANELAKSNGAPPPPVPW